MRNTTGIARQGTAAKRARLLTALIAIVPLLLLGSCDWLGSLVGADDYEPNDSIGEAVPIELDENYSAYIGEDDADFFSFRPAHGSDTYDAVEISVTGAGDDLKVGLALYDPDGQLFTSKNVNTGGADLTFTLRTPGLPAGDNFYIRFSGTDGWSGWEVEGVGDYDTQGPYTFKVRNLDANDEFAPNHTRGTAHPITIGESYSGVLVSTYETDWFSFTANSTSMTLTVTDTGSDLYLGAAWYGEGGNLIENETFETKGETGTITLDGMTAGEKHYLRLSGTDGWIGWEVDSVGDRDSRGPYTFSVE